MEVKSKTVLTQVDMMMAVSRVSWGFMSSIAHPLQCIFKMSHNFATCPELWLQTSYHKASIREWFFELSYVFATCPELARDKKTRSSFTPRKARDKLHLCVIFCAACLKNTMRNYNRNDFALTARDKLHLCVIFCVRGCCQRFTAWGKGLIKSSTALAVSGFNKIRV